jgi:segregation and condensation protein A
MDNNEQFQQEYIFDLPEEPELELSLSNFEGPLHLLLHLVKENKIEIKDIFVSQVTEQFIRYLGQIGTLDIDQASEYMSTAATLLEIKSFSLLPKLPLLEDEEDPEEVFIRKLEEYKLFKEVMADLKTQETVDRFYREPDKSVGEEVVVTKEKLSIEGFVAAFNKLLLKIQSRAGNENISRAIIKETFSVPDMIKRILDVLNVAPSVNFTELFDENTTRVELITTFSAVLELLRLQMIEVKQEELFGEITIVKRQGAALSEEEIYGTIE